MSVVHIYRIPQVVELTTPTGASLMNYPVNRTDFHIARFIDNEIEFWVKNVDRKAVGLTGMTATLYISEDKTGRVLLTRDLYIVDATKGLVRLFVSADESGSFPKGFLRYSVALTRPDGIRVMLYTDRERRGIGTIEVVDGPTPPPIESLLLSVDDFLSRNGKLYSSPLPGAAAVNNVSGQHSAVFHLSAFSGNITVQGSLEVQPSSVSGVWFDLVSTDYIDITQLVHLPFEGNLMNVRFVVTNDSGSINMIQYRN